MKCFICVADGMYLGIPADKTERIMPSADAGQGAILLADLLAFNDKSPVHALLIKNPVNKTLLTPKIESEIEIPEESVRRLPASLSPMEKYFIGASFLNENVLLIFNTDQLTEDFA